MQRTDKRTLKVIGVPIDLGVAKLGVDMGPTALRYAGIFDAFEYAGFTYSDAGDINVIKNFRLNGYSDTEHAKIRLEEISRVSDELGWMVSSAFRNDEFPIILGGDHSTSIGGIAGLSQCIKDIGLVWIDAHPDANTPQTSPSGNIHGMTVAISLGYGYDQLVNCLGFSPKLRPENICIVGAKDIDAGEQAFLEEVGIKVFSIFDIDKMGISAIMNEVVNIMGRSTDAVYVSFDTDVMDSSIAPGTGIKTKGGLSYREIHYVMDCLGRNLNVSCLDIIEVNPLLDIGNATAELCVELLMAALGVKYTEYEKNYLRQNVTTGPVHRSDLLREQYARPNSRSTDISSKDIRI